MKNISNPQAPAAVVMVRPHRFHPNPQTAADNGFQSTPNACASTFAAAAHEEVGRAAARLEREGVRVHLFEDRGEQDRPDSVFPNNWFSTHADGSVAIYPMHAPNRRAERRSDVIELLKTHYRVDQLVDYSGLEQDQIYLEGTGAMVLDHVQRVAYMGRSRRADERALDRFCRQFGYAPQAFDTAGPDGRPVYHSNVLMCIATGFAAVGFGLIRQPDAMRRRLQASGRALIDLSATQIAEFAGNALELSTDDGDRILALSERAAASLTAAQKKCIEASGARLVALAVPTIERAGGSVRCMLAGIHLCRR